MHEVLRVCSVSNLGWPSRLVGLRIQRGLRVGWRSQGCVGLGHASVSRIIDVAIPSLEAVARVLCLTGASCRVGSLGSVGCM
jgi:hypothetical protein